ncbi:aldehyde:ferredoxin oxidoreductase [Desulfacinum hydrothermale DSM 13146]|uniref:Aldehyde:ferredoxin oxidoreductase n=1 Tax=Desulfacinum hydrothermale DSM 13146 TaxID=1121390 RepID=A0A1W1X8I0_9BACT|nr:aldehyde ferredoxin oxidoreductase family protein [Desulfacinum hydrothermale]SMC20272.1 aldehyde:ferredoxin oxidoreductase [Desulfacinum hydrothermale DSM 13146]
MDKPGRIVKVDLTQSSIMSLAYSPVWSSAYLAGRGINIRLLLEHTEPDTEPLDPENVLILSCGLLTGTAAPASSRLHLSAASPLTGLLGSSSIGGHFGAHLRRHGIQALMICGKSPRPVVLRIGANGVRLEPAHDLWGRDTVETYRALRSAQGRSDVEVLCIGPAGERAVPMACIMSGPDHAAGRTGLGAVMGSKNLKAVVVDPPPGPPRYSSAAKETAARYVRRIRQSAEYSTFSTHGSVAYVGWCHERRLLATRNFRENSFPAAQAFDPQHLSGLTTRRKTCYRCPVHCKAELRLPGASEPLARPEFETAIALGPKCSLGDPQQVVLLHNLCSRLGLDAISAGTAIAFAMDLFERGILTAQDTDGLDLRWGDPAVMERLIEDMAQARGLGALLGQGVHRAAQSIGRGAERYAPHVHGLEMPAYHPGGSMATALGYLVSTRGADFTSVYATPEYRWSPEEAAREVGTPLAVNPLQPEGKPALVARSMMVSAVMDALGLCKVPALSLAGGFDLKCEAELVRHLTGLALEADDLLDIGKRILDLEQLANVGRGLDPTKDTLPEMVRHRPAPDGMRADLKDILERMRLEFFQFMGWTPQGIPRRMALPEPSPWLSRWTRRQKGWRNS